MIDQLPNQDIAAEQLLRALCQAQPALMGPATADCINWVVAGAANKAVKRTNVLEANMSGGALLFDTLGSRIRAAASSASLNWDQLTAIASSVDDASRFSDRYIAHSRPRISLTPEGAVLLAWEMGRNGTALLFVGDGTVVYSKSDDQHSYSETGLEQSITAEPPVEYRIRVFGEIPG